MRATAFSIAVIPGAVTIGLSAIVSALSQSREKAMFRCLLRVMVLAACLGAVSFADDEVPEQPPGRSNPIEGLWQVWWGGGADGRVIRLPALGELFVRGDRVELRHFPNLGNLTGTIRVDAEEKRIRITRKAGAADQAPEILSFAYEIKDDKLTLVSDGNNAIALDRYPFERDPLANTQVEIIAASGIDDAGRLLVTEFTALKVEDTDAPHFRPLEGKRELKEATVLLSQKAGLKRISLIEARALIEEPTPVVIAHLHEDSPWPPGASELLKEVGKPQPDSDAVLKTMSRVLRPGTLIFILRPQKPVVP